MYISSIYIVTILARGISVFMQVWIACAKLSKDVFFVYFVPMIVDSCLSSFVPRSLPRFCHLQCFTILQAMEPWTGVWE